MVDALVAEERVHSAAVEEALRTVPRHVFLPDVDLEDAYADQAVPVQHVDGVATSSASQPSMVAIMLEQLALAPGHRVLEIGAGTGWNAALMARIVGPAGSVTAVDIDADLIAYAAAHLAEAEVAGVALVCGDGAHGHPSGAPYDRIVLTVGTADVRPEWVAQLAPGGRLLLPLAVRGSQLSMALDLGPDGLLRSDSVRGCSFIRLRGIGAMDDVPMSLVGGPTLYLPADGPGADPDAVAEALRARGEPLSTPVELGVNDVFDGFGLWLALTEPGAARLLDPDPERALSGEVVAATALVTPPAAAAPGLALLAPAPQGTTVRPFGPAGPALAARLVAALDTWTAAGTPQASDWRVTVGPAAPEPASPDPAGPGAATVLTPLARMAFALPTPR